MFYNFKECISALEYGYFPYQSILGKYSYPTHNMSGKPDKDLYTNFDVNDLDKIIYVNYIYQNNNGFKLITKKIIHNFDIPK